MKFINSINQVNVGDILTFKTTYNSQSYYSCGEEYYDTHELMAKVEILKVFTDEKFCIVKNLFDFDLDKINENTELTDRRLYLVCNHQILLINNECDDEYNPTTLLKINANSTKEDIFFLHNFYSNRHNMLIQYKTEIEKETKNNLEKINHMIDLHNDNILELNRLINSSPSLNSLLLTNKENLTNILNKLVKAKEINSLKVKLEIDNMNNKFYYLTNTKPKDCFSEEILSKLYFHPLRAQTITIANEEIKIYE